MRRPETGGADGGHGRHEERSASVRVGRVLDDAAVVGRGHDPVEALHVGDVASIGDESVGGEDPQSRVVGVLVVVLQLVTLTVVLRAAPALSFTHRLLLL